MTVTISRLYDTYTDAQSAVQRLEAAGVPHSEISIVANNSDSWFSSDKKVDRDRDGVDDRASVRASAAQLAFSRDWACSRSPVSDRSLRPVGWRQPRLVQPPVRPLAASSAHLLRLVFRKKTLTPTPRASVEAVRWYLHGWQMQTVRVWMPS
jgi:hypothetical protein